MKVYRTILIASFIALSPLLTWAETVSIDPPATPVTVATPSVDLRLRVEPTSVAAGQDVVYTLTIANTGDTAFTNLSAQYDLPVGFSFVDGTSPSALKKLGTLAPNAAITKSFTLRAGAAANGNVPLEMMIDAAEFDLHETIAFVEVRSGEVLGAETLVETGRSPIGMLLGGFGLIAIGTMLWRRQNHGSTTPVQK